MITKTSFRQNQYNKELFSESWQSLPFKCLYAMEDSFIDGTFPWHWHSEMEIDYIVEGNMEFRMQGMTLYVPKGSAVFINSGNIHSFCTDSPKGCLICAILFSPRFLANDYQDEIFRKYISPIVGSSLPAVLIPSGDPVKDQMLTFIKQALWCAKKEPLGYEMRIRSELSSFWCTFFEHFGPAFAGYAPAKAADSERLKQMLSYIHSHYMDSVSLRNIADSASIGERECNRCFKNGIHQSPMEYLNYYRIQNAARLLLTTGDSITAISENCGFSSISYFGKVFHQLTGFTPRQYRSAQEKFTT